MPNNGQWGWAEFEELLQCPVCLEVPATGPRLTVEQCIHGHHICFSCKSKLENCPLCKCPFHGTRNFVVEELVRHYEILKNTMLLSNLVVPSKPKKKKKIPLNGTAAAFKEPSRRNVNTPRLNKGPYPCRVDDCDVVLPASRLLNHVRSCHAENLTESIVDFNHTYSQVWEVQFRNKKAVNPISFVVFVSGIGLIFLNLEILHTGQLIAVVRTSMKCMAAHSYMADLEFYTENGRYSHLTQLVSVRESIVDMINKKNCFLLQKNQLKGLCVGKKFNCKLRLSQFDPTNSDLLSFPNVQDVLTVAGIRASLLEEEKRKALQKSQPTKNKNTQVNGIPTRPENSGGNALEKLFGTDLYEIMKTLHSVELHEFVQSTSRQPNVNNVTTPAPTSTQTGKRKKNRKKR